jgi:N-acetyltransferase 10
MSPRVGHLYTFAPFFQLQDVHSRYRTEGSGEPIARFNERFILSLGSCPTCLVLDDELNVLPISSGKDIESVPASSSPAKSASAVELEKLKASLADTQPVGSAVDITATLDQAKALLTFTDAIASKTLSTTVALTAARGRGKSACLGLAIALAVAHGYSNIFVTSPSPENLGTAFEFVFKGLEKLGYTEHLDWEVIRSVNKDWKGAVVRVNIFRDHRQTIQVNFLFSCFIISWFSS